MVEELSEDEEHQNKDVNPMDRDGESNLDDDVDLESPLLDGMLSDSQPALNQANITACVAAAMEMKNYTSRTN